MEQQPHQPWPGPQQSPGGWPPHPPYAQPLPYQGGWTDPYQPMRDAEHLRMLAICHYVWGGVTVVFSMCGLIYVFVGLVVVNDPSSFNGTNPRSSPPPPAVGYMFASMGALVVVLGCLVGGLTIFSGRCIAKRKNRTFSLIMAAVNCLSMPVGTTLGVFTFIVLLRESVRAQYAGSAGHTG
jgi:hypothetical protein